MEIEVVELTEAQARELRRFTKRALEMYRDRDGSGPIKRTLRPVKDGLEDVKNGEKDALRLGLGLQGDERERIVAILENEIEMEEKKNRQGWGIGGTKLNAAKRGLDALRDPEVTEEEI